MSGTSPHLHPALAELESWSDIYFTRTAKVVQRFGDVQVRYAVFMRAEVVSAPALAIYWLQSLADAAGETIEIDLRFAEGEAVPARTPLLYITGSHVFLSATETQFLAKLGPACIAARNAFRMCRALPKAAFLAFDARHDAGSGMIELMAYGASVGGKKAQAEAGAKGFVNSSVSAVAHYFGQKQGFGTMPHALIGYAGSTLRAAEMFHETFPDVPLTVLVDYFGQEVTDSLACCARFPELAAAGTFSIRLDTPGERYLEGLDEAASIALVEAHAPKLLDQASERERGWLIGTGVTAAAIFRLRQALDEAGYNRVTITASSGFNAEKCALMAQAGAPIDFVGTGSFIPSDWKETMATADIIRYGDVSRVKSGREYLLND